MPSCVPPPNPVAEVNGYYTFKHALTQDVAYSSLPGERQSGLHERVAQATERVYGDRLEEHYGELAYHYHRSGHVLKAVDYLHRAGQQAAQRSANAEAIGLLTTALDVLKTVPDTPVRRQQELTLLVTLGGPLMATKGFTAPEVEQVYVRARELCRQAGNTPQLFPIVFGLRTFMRCGPT
jgi:predicted ATPase